MNAARRLALNLAELPPKHNTRWWWCRIFKIQCEQHRFAVKWLYGAGVRELIFHIYTSMTLPLVTRWNLRCSYVPSKTIREELKFMKTQVKANDDNDDEEQNESRGSAKRSWKVENDFFSLRYLCYRNFVYKRSLCAPMTIFWMFN